MEIDFKRGKYAGKAECYVLMNTNYSGPVTCVRFTYPAISVQ